MRILALAFLAGVLLSLQLPALPERHWLWAGLLGLPWLLRGPWPLRLAAGLAAGMAWTMWQAHLLAANPLPAALEGRDLQVQGHIAGLPELRQRGVRFLFEVEDMRLDGETWQGPRRLRLAWYQNPPALNAGERWRLTVRLKRAHGFANPGGMDYERWLFRQGIGATGYVRAQGNQRLGATKYAHVLAQWRQQLRDSLRASLSGSPFAGIVLALTVGDRSGMDPQQWQRLTATGTNHLMAISGLHIGLVAGLVFLSIRGLWRWLPLLPLYLPAPQAAALASLLAGLLYAALAGFAIPTQRALIMLAVVLLGVLCRRSLAPGQGLALALLLVLLWDPLAAVSAGFWLSFAAVAAIFYTMGGRLRPGGWWWRWGRVQVVLALALLPLLLNLFQQASLVAPLANLLAVPWMSLLVIPPALLGTALVVFWPGLAQPLLQLAELALQGLWWLLGWLAGLPFAVWHQSMGSGWVLAATVFGVIWLLAPRGLPGRALGLVWLAPLLLLRPERPAPGEAWLHLLDVGQGLAAVVQTHRHDLVFDTGPRFSADFDAGEAVILPFLRQRGIDALDRLIVSHGDNDHLGGAASLRRALPVADVLSSVPGKLPGARACRAGQRWLWDEVYFEILNPDAAMARRGGNDASCVLRVSNAGGALLLTGDIEARAERHLLTRPAPLAAQLLVAPHHGSLTSSTAAFIDAVAPRWVLFPVGYRNRFAFPRPQVVARYRKRNIGILDSATSGMISVRLARTGVQPPVSYRHSQPRFWRNRFDAAGPRPR